MQMMMTAITASRRAILPVSMSTMFCSTVSMPAAWAKAGSTMQTMMAAAMSVDAARGRRLVLEIIHFAPIDHSGKREPRIAAGS